MTSQEIKEQINELIENGSEEELMKLAETLLKLLKEEKNQ